MGDTGDKKHETKKGVCMDMNMINQLCAPETPAPTPNKGFPLA